MSASAALKPWCRLAPTVFMLAWGGNHFTPLLHLYESEGHYSAWQANLLLGLYVVGLVPGLLVASAASDHHGRRPILACAVVSGIFGSALLALGAHSFVLLCCGRAFAGIGVGIAMSVGTSWMKELSAPPYDNAEVSAGARRPALTITLGFAVGAAVTGMLAAWAPAPRQLPYLVHIAASLLAAVPALKVPETLSPQSHATGAWWRDLRVPAAGHRTFTGIVMPAAPWVFGAAGVAYAIMPAIAAPQLGDATTLYATGLTVATLGAGAAVQPFAARLDDITKGRALALGLGAMTVGMALSVAAAATGEPLVALAVAIVLGLAYGITVVAGLARVQAIATASDLAGLTGVYYSLAYSGFLLPAALAALLPLASYQVSLTIVTLICATCCLIVTTRTAKDHPHD